MKTKPWVWATFLCCWAPSFRAHAQQTPTELKHARTLFSEAAELQASRLWGQAAARYREAASIKDTPGLRFRAGYCEAQRARLLEAKREYERARALLEKQPTAEDVRRLLPDAMARLEARIPTLTIKLANLVNGVVLVLDSVQLSVERLGKRLPLNPGVHSLLLRAPSGWVFSRRVRLREGERRTLVAHPGESPSTSPATQADRRPEGSSNPTLDRSVGLWTSPSLLAGAGLTAIGLAGGLTYLYEERQAANRYDRRVRELGASDCREPGVELRAQCGALQEAVADQKRARWWAGLGFATAGVGATVALTSAWLSSGSKVTTSATITSKSAALTLRGSM